MAIKKSELYSKLWASCDALRGGMDASQYKDFVLILLFLKYVSDKYKNNPKAEIEDILKAFTDISLIDKYDVYQYLMNFWNETMQDDCYLITVDGWKAEVSRIFVENKKKEQIDKGWTCDLVPAYLVINRHFDKEKKAKDKYEAAKEAAIARLEELVEENSGEDGYFSDFEKVNKITVQS